MLAFMSCKKSSLFPDPFHIDNADAFEDRGLPDDAFGLSAAMAGSAGSTIEVREEKGTIYLPVQTRLTLKISEISRAVKNLKWTLNGKVIASGNNVAVTLATMGAGNLNVSFTEAGSGVKHSRDLQLYAYKQMTISMVIHSKVPVCGPVAVGISSSSPVLNVAPLYLENSIQNICTTESNNTARIARVPVKVYDAQTSFSIDLIEPNKVTTKNATGFCILFICFGGSSSHTTVNPKQVYQTDTFLPSQTANLSPGTYTSGGTQLTLE
ncbi:hypothetical protein GCM10027051_10150 [Niabella terrae]